MQNYQTPREVKLRRKSALYNERSSWDAHWKEISDYQLPRAGRFFHTDRNQGKKRHNNIYDNTAMFSLRTLAAGMMAGMTSPARPWFRLGIKDKDLMEAASVKAWLHDTAELIRAIYSQSNTYRALHGIYEELGAFGTAASFVLPDYDSVIHCYPMTVGEYAVSTDHRGNVDTIVRELDMTVGQIVGQFGIENVSNTLKTMWDRGNYDAWVTIMHMVEPNRNRDLTKKDQKNKKFSSVYFETGSDNNSKFLRESGYSRFPALVPRWVVTGNDIYGTSPGMECLGDVKQLQHEQFRKAQAIDYKVNPPLQVPSQYKDHTKARLPGGVFHVDATSPGGGVRSAFEFQIDLQHLLMDIQDVRERIRSAYYADLFLMMANDTRSGITATEVAERHEEKLLMLGPVLERLHNELLSPMIDITFDACVEANILPPIPPELEGFEIEIEFISTLAQAQRAVAAQGMDQLITRVGAIAQLNPEIVDKVNFDQMIDDTGDMFGVNPKLIIPDEEVAKKRAARAQQQQMQQMAAMAPPMATAAKDLGGVDGENVSDVINMFQGYGTPSPSQV
jgi:hypothetical protein